MLTRARMRSKESGSSTPRPTCHHLGFSEDTKCKLPREGRAAFRLAAESTLVVHAPV